MPPNETPSPAPDDRRRAAILSIGDEILLGDVADTNAAELARGLVTAGYAIDRILTVGDDQDAIAGAVRDLAGHADLLLLSGGLGPTDDDRTRHALAEVAGTELRERPELVETIARRFERMGRAMRPSNRIQAALPEGTEAIENARGTAPGIAGRLGGCRFFALPGVPAEMRAMLREAVLPNLPPPAGPTLRYRHLHFHGEGESTLGERIREWMRPGSNPLAGTTVREGTITVRLRAAASDAGEAERLLDEAETAIRERCGASFFGAEEATLASVVLDALAEERATVACAESCTGGLVAAALTAVPGASDVFLGGYVTYSNRQKREVLGVPGRLIEEHGAVSEPVAEAMALGARRRAQAEYALALTGIAGPGGGSEEKPVGTVWIALATASQVRAWRFRFLHGRAGNRTRSVHMALDLLRRRLCGLPSPAAARDAGPAAGG